MAVREANQVVVKTPSEVIFRDVEFDEAGMGDAEVITTIDSLTVSPSGELTVPTQTPSGQVVQLQLANGVDGTDYKITIRVITDGGQTIEGCCKVSVRSC